MRNRKQRVTGSVVVASLGAPEINHLAIELERRGELRRYVRPYMNKRRGWERFVESMPALGPVYGRTLGRRKPPEGLALRNIVEAGVASDFAGAGLARLFIGDPKWRRQSSQRLSRAVERAVARRVGRMAEEAQHVVASYGTGRFAFEAVRRAGGQSVLSYPIAHNDYQARLYAEDAELAPEFAAALPRLSELPREYTDRLAIECEIADRILVGSSFVRQSFIAMGYESRRIAVAPYGVDTERFSPRASPRKDKVFRVLFVGQIGQRKGMGYLLQAYERFRRTDTELHVVGDYASGHEVYARFADQYRRTANVPNRALPAIFHDADVFVLPSLIEGMPLVVLEAMACGLPVITTAQGPADVLRHGIDGFLVPIRDPDAIAARFEQLYHDRSQREQMGSNARARALEHTWGRFARQAADIVLQAHSGSAVQ